MREKEYGGYLEIEQPKGEEFYSGLHRLNLGRTAAVWLLSNIDHDRVFLPEYICDTVTESLTAAGFKLVSYRQDEDLKPVWGPEGEPGDRDVFYVVNYNGTLSDSEIAGYRGKYHNVIADNAQAFFNRPVEGVHTLYSVRKFVGAADGAYVASTINASEEDLPYDRSAERALYLAGRLEGSANEFYSASKAAELAYSNETPKRMSLFTQNILRGADYDLIRERRIANYKTLQGLIGGDNPFNRRETVCPYTYPFYHKDGIGLRKYLVSKKIYVPTLWSFLLDEAYNGSLEQDWSANITWLPIDQRYDEEDMKYIADVIRSF